MIVSPRASLIVASQPHTCAYFPPCPALFCLSKWCGFVLPFPTVMPTLRCSTQRSQRLLFRRLLSRGYISALLRSALTPTMTLLHGWCSHLLLLHIPLLCATAPCSDANHVLLFEALQLLLVSSSSQVFCPVVASPPGIHPMLEAMLVQHQFAPQVCSLGHEGMLAPSQVGCKLLT